MKYLKTFEFYRNDLLQKFKNNNWTLSDILNKDEENIYIEECIGNFLEMFLDDFNYIQEVVYSNDYIYVKYSDNDGDDIDYHITGRQLADFIRYLNNPEVYTDSKKYNL